MQFLLVEPVAKTPYPPLGLMKIASWLKHSNPGCKVFPQTGNGIPTGLSYPKEIYITSLFTWDLDKVISAVHYYRKHFPHADVKVGGIAASLLPEYIRSKTGVNPHIGLFSDAEQFQPDYSLCFGRKIRSSITMTTRGCIRRCKFCSVKTVEPDFFVKADWEKDICHDLPWITFWDNNWLASPNFKQDCKKLQKLGKRVDFNQGLDARLYDENKAKAISKINIDPIRFAFDDLKDEDDVIRAVRFAKKYSRKEVSVYVLYNYNDTPEDFYHRVNVLNREGALAFPMEYRGPDAIRTKFPGYHWNTKLLRALKLSLLFFYRKGTITESRETFLSFYGQNHEDFVNKLYEIYKYDRSLKRSSPTAP